MDGAWVYSTGRGRLVIHDNVYIGRNFKAILGDNDIVIEKDCNIGDYVTISTQLHSKSSPDGYKDLQPVKIGKGSLLASNVFVYKNLPPGSRVKVNTLIS